MAQKIKTIDIKAFRGIPSLELDLDRKNILIRGENGSGKSSLVEAIEFLFTGRLSIFEGEGTQSLSLIRHAPHKNYEADDVQVSLTFDPGAVRVTRTLQEFSDVPTHLRDYFQAAEEGSFILRRSQLLQFIWCRAGDRYNAIAGILGIERLDEIELVMKGLRDKLEGAVISKQDRLQKLREDISSLLSKEISRDINIVKATNAFLVENHLNAIDSLNDIVVLHFNITDNLAKKMELGILDVINKTQITLETLDIDDEIIQDIKKLYELVESILQEKTKMMDIAKRELLIQGQNIITQEQSNVCPLCEQEINTERTRDRINERLKTLGLLSEEASNIRQLGITIEEKLKTIKGELNTIYGNIKSLPELEDHTSDLEKLDKLLENFLEQVKSAIELKKNIKLESIQDIQSFMRECINSLSQKCNSLLEEAKIPENIRKLLEITSILALLRDKVSELLHIKDLIQLSRTQRSLSQKLFNAFSNAKKEKINEIYNTISSDLNSFYTSLHSDDPHKDVKLNIIPTRRASTELKINSFDREGEDPRALTSEGHQDSLGLCIFLAFVKNFNRECNLIVLDDVVSAIDAQHRDKICDLLLNEFKDYQLIITTHDEVWFNQIRNHQRALGVQGNFKNLVITRWDPDNGPAIEPYKPRWERIQEKLTASDKTGAGIEGRLYVEWLLKNVCDRIKAAVPYNISRRHTIGELLEPTKRRFLDLVKDETFQKRIEDGFRILESRITMANLVAHDNPMIETVSIEEVRGFCEAVNELKNILSCPSCNSLLRYYQDRRRLTCPNSKCRDPLEIVC